MERRFLSIAWLLIGLAAPSFATAQSYCAYNPSLSSEQEKCFPSLAQAEGHLRRHPTQPVRRAYLRPLGDFVDIGPNGAKVGILNYETRPMPPKGRIVTWYHAGTGQQTPTPIGEPEELLSQLPGESIPGRTDESTLFSDVLDRDAQAGPGQAFGFYRQPEGGSGRIRPDPLNLGRAQVEFHFDNLDAPRRFFSGLRDWSVYKKERWWCPPGLDKVRPDGTCTNEEIGSIWIYALPQHSCPATPNPCIPGTGAKELHETDFTWGAWAFKRNYSSLGGLALDHVAGTQWRHTFQARLVAPNPGYPRGHLLDENGYFEFFGYVSSTQYRSQNQTGKVLRPTGDGTQPWAITAPDGRQDFFDAAGRRSRIVLPDDPANSVVLTYCDSAEFAAGACTARDQLWKVTNGLGRTLEFTYSPTEYFGPEESSAHRLPRLISISGDDGPQVGYEYDEAGRLTTAVYPGGRSRTYHYGEATHICLDAQGNAQTPCPTEAFENHLTGVTDERGVRLTHYTYDNAARVSSSTWAGGAYPEKVSYPGALTRGLTHRSGRVETLTYAVYNGFKKPTARTDAAGTTQLHYDGLGRLWRTTDKRGTVTEYEYAGERVAAQTRALGTAQQRRDEFVWNATLDRVEEQRVRDGAGALKERRTIGYNLRRQITTTTLVDPADASRFRTTTRTYCEAADVALAGSTCPILGLLKSIDGPRTDVADLTTFAYYPSTDESGCATSGPCHRQGDPWKVTNALGHVSETLSYDRAGRATATKDPNGVVTELAYHPRGWLTSRTVKGNTSAEDAVTTYTYDDAGQLTRLTRPDGDWTAFEYDDAHRLTAIEDALGNRIEYTLDSAGERTAETAKDPTGLVTRSLSREYDALGRLDLSHDAYTHTTDFGYDANGNPTSVEDPLGHETQQEYDPLDRLKRTLQDAGGLDVETQYAYDAQDRLVKVTDPKGLETTYTYNALGDLTQLSSPDTGLTYYTHDAAGNRLTQTDARGITAAYDYDALNRLTSVTYPTSSLDVHYVYDEADPLTGCAASFPTGRLTRMTDGSGSTTYCYDRRGNMTRKTQAVGSTIWTLGYTYDLADHLVEIDYPDAGPTVGYGRDSRGAITSVTIDGEPFITSVARDPDGQPTSLLFADGDEWQRAYDNNGAVASVVSSALDLHYSRNELGDVVGIGADRIYHYDALRRLTQVRDGVDTALEAYAYDATGNRLSKTMGGIAQFYQYPATSHRLADVAGAARTYDAAGGTLTIGGDHYTYDDAHRLASVTGAGAATFAYNGRGERVRKGEEVFLFDEAGHLLVSTHEVVAGFACQPATCPPYCGGGSDDARSSISGLAGGAKSATQPSPAACGIGQGMAPFYERKPGWVIWMDDLPVAFVPAQGLMVNEGVLKIHTDALGTPRALQRPWTNEVVWRWDVEGSAFGEHAPQDDPDGDNTELEFGLRYPGQYFDAESGLHYNYFRDYAPGEGRYIQSDPIGIWGGIATFGYASQTPLMQVDPRGLSSAVLEVGKEAAFIWGVGGNYCFSAAVLAKELAQWESDATRWPGPGDGPRDALRHCTWTCKITRMAGTKCAQIAGFAHEAEGFGLGQKPEQGRMDFANNRQGEMCGLQDGDDSCLVRCKNAYMACKLQIIGGVPGCGR